MLVKMTVEVVRRMGVVAGVDPPEGRMVVIPGLCDATGVPTAGVLAALADSVSGVHALEVLGDTVALTADLSLHVAGVPVEPGALLVAGSRVLKRRRTGAVLEVEVTEAEVARTGIAGPPRRIATATVTYAQVSGTGLERPDSFTLPATEPWPPDDLCTSLADLLPLREVGPDELELAIDRLSCNSVNVLSGGAIVMAADAIAQRSAGRVLGGPVTVTDLVVHFLAPGRVGPAAVRAEMVARHGDRASVRVTLVDRGDGDRLIAAATASTVLTTSTVPAAGSEIGAAAAGHGAGATS